MTPVLTASADQVSADQVSPDQVSADQVSADQVTELVSRAREDGAVALADLHAAFDRCELMPEVVDDVMRMLAEDGVETPTAAPTRPMSPSEARSPTGPPVRNLGPGQDLPARDRQGTAADGPGRG
jgi:hypothetical protein